MVIDYIDNLIVINDNFRD